MKKLVLIILITILPTSLLAQKLTKEEAINYAKKLYEINILSEKGRDSLLKKIENKEIERWKKPDLNDGSISVADELSVSHILLVCSSMFEADFYYRIGLIEQERLMKEDKEIINLYKNIDEQDEKALEKAQQAIEEKMEDFEGFKIEERILLEDDTTGKTYQSSFLMPNFSSKSFGYIHQARSVLGKQNLRTLRELKEIGLINEKIYNEALNLIEKNWLNTSDLFNFLFSKAVFYEDFEENKIAELAFIDNLRRQGLMNKENQDKLVASYLPFELKEKFEFVRYCEKAIIVDVKKLPIQPEKAYPVIFEQIKTLIPTFTFTDFQVQLITEDLDREFKEQKIHFSLNAGGRTYKSNFFYDYIKKTPDEKQKTDTLFKIGEEFHKIVNRFLTDQNSEYRLYYANKSENEHGGVYSEDEFGLILMTEEQAKAWGRSSYFIFEENHDNTFNQENIQAIIADYQAISLFKHLSQNEIEIGKNKVKEDQINHYIDILRCFPKIVMEMTEETGNFKNPYEELLKEIATISGRVFNPIQIIDTFEKSQKKTTTKLSFTLNKKKYSQDLEMNGDHLDYAFIELVEKAMEEQNIGGKIYYCGELTFIFLNKAQYSYLKETQPKLFSED
ncbi:MAG: hypothetical protein MUF43_14415 [Flavobacterium sp.]|jgi:hypothetical protein|nr:hypothetical protein [Flavobacterium sp.]